VKSYDFILVAASRKPGNIMHICYIQVDQSPEKPGNVRELQSGQGKDGKP